MSRPHETLPPQGGILLVDKPGGWTSHDIVAKSRRSLGTRKVGHAGTLDPMATGLLILGAGPATRLLTYLVGLDKTYTATIRLGVSTVTDDREGDETERADPHLVEELFARPGRLLEAAANLTGEILQTPSTVSAIKVDGRRAYDRVRAGEEVALKARPVTVSRFELGEPRLSADVDDAGRTFPVIDIDVEVDCSTGTYVRALARDLGGILGVGGHLTALRRTAVGPFEVGGAVSHEIFSRDEGQPTPIGALQSPADIARRLFASLDLTAEQAVALGQGKRVEVTPESAPEGVWEAADVVAAFAPDGRLIGLVSVASGRLRVRTNFPTPDAEAAPESLGGGT